MVPVPSCQPINNCTTLEECCYKHIRVSVSRANIAQEMSLDTIVSALVTDHKSRHRSQVKPETRNLKPVT